MTKIEERREFQRLDLALPIEATLADSPVRIIDLGVLGAGIEHPEPIEVGGTGLLRFSAGGEPVEFDCGIVRSRSAEAGWRSGLRFFEALGDSDQTLRRFLLGQVTALLEAMRSDQSQPESQIDMDETVRSEDARYLTFRIEEGRWKKRPAFTPEQPENGFTVATGQDELELAKLCFAYAVAEPEERRLIRMFAELSISKEIGVPPRRSE